MESNEEKEVTDNNIPDPILTKVSSFPSMPRAAMKLRELLAKDDVSMDEIEKILRQDPGLATNVLRLANSAFFGVPRKVETLKHAVTLLGIKRFAQIAVSASMSKPLIKLSKAMIYLPEISGFTQLPYQIPRKPSQNIRNYLQRMMFLHRPFSMIWANWY